MRRDAARPARPRSDGRAGRAAAGARPCRAWAAAALAALAAPAAAQTAADDPEAAARHAVALEGCRRAAPDADALAACAGLAERACLDGEAGSGGGALMLRFCASVEAAAWEPIAAELEARLLARAEAADADAEADATTARFDERASALRGAQAAWSAFRDAECALEAAWWGDGSGRTLAQLDCEARLIADRAVALRRKLEAEAP